MKKILRLVIVNFLLLTSCQKEVSFPPAPPPPPPEQLVAAIAISNAAQNEYDSIVYRYAADKIREVHYHRFGDSVTRTYSYDVAGRLTKIEDENAIYFTNNNIAHTIRFQYNNAGQLIKTLTDFETVSGIPAYFTYTSSGNLKKMIVYDTSYFTASYSLDWANRIVYNTMSSDNYLRYDSTIYLNNASGGIKAEVSDFNYDANKNVTSIREATYQSWQLSEWGDVSVTFDTPAPVFEGLRKKLFRNLANWYDASSVWQDDNYRLFTVPGHMYKRLAYSGYSLYGGTTPLTVIRGFDFQNEYDNNLLVRSIVTITVSGQGNIHYVNDIRYYYK